MGRKIPALAELVRLGLAAASLLSVPAQPLCRQEEIQSSLDKKQHKAQVKT